MYKFNFIRIFTNFFKPRIREFDGKIVVIGPRSSGKTTYLAGLAYFPQKFKVPRYEVRVDDYSKDSLELLDNANKILRKGKSFVGTKRHKSYEFTININNYYHQEKINLTATDFPGEGLEKIANQESGFRKDLEKILTDRDTCYFMILLSDWQDDDDIIKSIKTFGDIIKSKVPKQKWKEFRFAVVMNKCERGELWPSRIDPEMDLFIKYLRGTTDELQNLLEGLGVKKNKQGDNLKFFAMSTFGVLGNDDPRPNRKDEIISPRTLDNEEVCDSTLYAYGINQWKPYGMISPLYWLATKKRLSPDV